jgi:hypothetical protein
MYAYFVLCMIMYAYFLLWWELLLSTYEKPTVLIALFMPKLKWENEGATYTLPYHFHLQNSVSASLWSKTIHNIFGMYIEL